MEKIGSLNNPRKCQDVVPMLFLRPILPYPVVIFDDAEGLVDSRNTQSISATTRKRLFRWTIQLKPVDDPC